MKNIRIILGIVLLNISLFAFEAGTYVCNTIFGDAIYTIKSNSQYKIDGVMGQTERGNWLDHDDAALLYTNNGEVTIEQKNNKPK
jgi:hypothetical protein